MLDVLIQNGTVIDGTGRPGFQADVGVEDGRITLVGRADGAEAEATIDATGKMVCPGIIDPHSHADLSMFREGHERMLDPLVRQGITTFVGGNCGMAMAPIEEKNRRAVGTYLSVFTQVDMKRDVQWRSMGEFLDQVESQGLVMNSAVLAPHGLLRLNACGMEMRPATGGEIAHMRRSLEEALDAGAVGLSTGLQYFPGSQSDTEELVQLGQVLHRKDGIFTSHIRSYTGSTLDNAIDEVCEVAERSDIRAQISHMFWIPDFGVFGKPVRAGIRGLAKLSKWWTAPIPLAGGIGQRIERMVETRKRGVNVAMDAMPTTTGFTHLLAFFPPWALEGTSREVLERMQNPIQRKRMLHSIEHGKMKWPHTGPDAWSLNLFRLMGWQCARIMAVASEQNKHYEGMRLVDIARERGMHPFDAACDLLLEEDGQVLVFESMAEPGDRFTERSIFAGMAHPEVMISTDAILMGFGRPSTLFYGAYPWFVQRYVRELGLLPIEAAVRKMTSLAAEHFHLKARGTVAEGNHADLLVFDYDSIGSTATFLEPEQYPTGIEHVFINGHHVVDGAEFRPDAKPGQLLRSA